MILKFKFRFEPAEFIFSIIEISINHVYNDNFKKKSPESIQSEHPFSTHSNSMTIKTNSKARKRHLSLN